MSMQMLINDACAARERPYYPVYEGYDDYDDRPAQDQIAATGVKKPAQITPAWLTTGLQQYVDLVGLKDGTIMPRDPDEDFGHLAASAEPSESGSELEIVSSALYIPQEAKIGKAALRGNAYIVQAVLGLGANGDKKSGAKPRLALNLVQIGAEGSDSIARVVDGKSAGTPRLREEDIADDSGNLSSLVRVKSDIKKPKTEPQIKDAKVTEQKDGTWAVPNKAGRAAAGLLKEFLRPTLDTSIQRVRIEVPTNLFGLS